MITSRAADQVPFLDLAAPTFELRGEIDAAVRRVLDRGWYVLGPEVESFEAAWASYCGAAECVGVGSGLAALELALRAVGVEPGREVIVPSNTYIATWLAVTNVGATVVPVEPDPRTYNIDPSSIEDRLTERTAAILAVHLYGHPADMGPIMAVAGRHGLPVVVDGAQGHGCTWRPSSAQPDATAWSFYPSKNLGALGDGGAVTTSRADVAARIRALRNYGSTVKNEHLEVGTNSRLDELQAAVLSVKLAHLDEWNDRRRRLAGLYLSGIDPDAVTLPEVAGWADPVWHLFVIRSPRRDQLEAHLAERGVSAMVHYPVPPHLQPAYRGTGVDRMRLVVSERLHAEVLSLPLHPQLSETHAEQVISAVNAFTQVV